MSASDPDLIGPDEVAFTLDLTPAAAEDRPRRAALHARRLRARPAAVHRIIHELLAKLPDEASIRAIDLDAGV